jgi:uncharacterized protein YpbB
MKLETKAKKLFKYYKKLLKLRGWKFIIIHSDTLTDCARITYTTDKEVTLTINRKRNVHIEELEDTIIHELMHVFLFPYTDYVDNTLSFIKNNPENIKKLNFNKILKRSEQIEERLVERLATVLSLIRGG